MFFSFKTCSVARYNFTKINRLRVLQDIYKSLNSNTFCLYFEIQLFHNRAICSGSRNIDRPLVYFSYCVFGFTLLLSLLIALRCDTFYKYLTLHLTTFTTSKNVHGILRLLFSASSSVDRGFKYRRVKPKTIKLVFVASPLRTQH
jgi:hypothetical protein